MSDLATIGVTGLAVMGSNLARNFARHGHTVAVHNRTNAKTAPSSTSTAPRAPSCPPSPPRTSSPRWRRPRRIIIMVKAGDPTDAVIDELVPLLEEGDIVVDGGNAHFEDTRRREAALREHGLHFVGTGISGRRGRRARGSVDHAGRLQGVVCVPRADPRVDRRPGRRRAVLRLDGPGRRRPLRQDGPQRHRVRRHAVHRRGLRRPLGGRAVGRRGAPASSASGTPATSTPSSSRSPPRCSTRSTRSTGGAARRASSSTRPSRRAPAAGRCRPPSSSACPCRRSPSRSSPGPPPATPPSARRRPRVLAGPDRAVSVDDRQRLRRRRPRRALGVEGRRLRAGSRADPQGQRGVRLGRRHRDRGPDLARRLHHPRAAPGPDQRRVRRRRRLATLLVAPSIASGLGGPAGRVATRRRARRRRRACRCPGSRRPSPTTTRCGPSGCRPRSCRGCATTSAPTPTAAPTAPAPSTPCGRATGARSPRRDRRIDADRRDRTDDAGSQGRVAGEGNDGLPPHLGATRTSSRTTSAEVCRPEPAGSASPSRAASTPASCWPSPCARSAPARVVAVLGVSPSLAADERRGAHDVAAAHRRPGRRGRHPRGRQPGLPGQRPRPLLPLQGRAVHPDLRRGRRPRTGSTPSPTARTPTTRAGPTGPAPGRRPSTGCSGRWPTPA